MGHRIAAVGVKDTRLAAEPQDEPGLANWHDPTEHYAAALGKVTYSPLHNSAAAGHGHLTRLARERLISACAAEPGGGPPVCASAGLTQDPHKRA